jgi:hypothetical protein
MIKKTEIRIPLVTWRDGRPRFFPAPELRKAFGIKGEDLRHPDGSWFTVEEASAWSEAKQDELRTLRQKSKGQTPARSRRMAASLARASGLPTLSQVVTDFCERNPRMLGKDVIEGKKTRKGLSPKTIQNYKAAARLVENLEDGRFWNELAAALTPKNMEILLDRFEVKHGLAQTRQLRALLSVAYAHGIRTNMVLTNPIRHMEERLPTLAPRVRYGSIEAIRTLVAAADLVGRPEVGDIVIQGVWFGQRQADRLGLLESQMEQNIEALFRQRKKGGQPLLIPIADIVASRHSAAQERRKDWRVNWPHVNLDERQRRPFNGQHYTHLFQEIRTTATYGIWRLDDGTLASPLPKDISLKKLKRTGLAVLAYVPAWDPELPPCEELDGFRDQDLRDTAVTWLARAGCDTSEIASITGHSLKSVNDILKHYLGLHPDLARRAIGKLSAWYEEAQG